MRFQQINDAQSHGLKPEFKRERRLAALGEKEVENILEILSERSRLQKDAMQIRIDKRTIAVPVLLDALGKAQYQNVQGDIIDMLYEIGLEAIDAIVAAVQDLNTSTAVKIVLVRLIGRIDGGRVTGDSETIRNSTDDAGLEMEISTALYKLGQTEYRSVVDLQLTYNLDQYFQHTEQNELVKSELRRLLFGLE
jgi:hypothetical protein